MSQTEDDTYRVLTRTPKHDMAFILSRLHNATHDYSYKEWMTLKTAVLEIHGWTLYEFHKKAD